MATVLVVLLFLTDILLLLVYRPSVDLANGSVWTLTREVPFGLWFRNIHHGSARPLP